MAKLQPKTIPLNSYTQVKAVISLSSPLIYSALPTLILPFFAAFKSAS